VIRKIDTARDLAAVSRLARRVKRLNLTYLSWRSLRQLERAVDRALHVPGDFLECGVALGGSAAVICSRLPADRTLHVYDVFSTIPEPASAKDGPRARERYATIASGRSEGIGGERYYGYLPDLKERVRRTLNEHCGPGRAELHEGLFEDTLHPDQPVAFAHLDCDWYEPVRTCLERIYPHLEPGGFLVCDDYHNFEGAKAAVDEFLADAPDVAISREVMGARPPDVDTSLVLQRARA
jgi:asparagine synthase (glutamine-hydrolysing)